MKVDLQVLNSHVVAGEDSQLRITLANDSHAVRIPLLLEESPALVLEVLNGEGKMVAQGSGHDKLRRKGFGSSLTPLDKMEADEFPSGESATIEENLLDFVDLPHGKYQLRARVAYPPGGLNAVSEPAGITVGEHRPAWMDALADQVCVPCLYSLSKHEQRDTARVLLRISKGFDAQATLTRGACDLPAGVQPRISQANFLSGESIDEDLFRWIAWTRGGRLELRAFAEGKPSGGVIFPDISFAAEGLVGRPVQHQDRSATVIVFGASAEKNLEIRQIRCDATGAVISSRSLGLPEGPPAPNSSAIGPEGAIFCLVAEDRRLPLTLYRVPQDGASNRTVVLAEKQLRKLTGDVPEGHPIQVLAVRVRPNAGVGELRSFVAVAVYRDQANKPVLCLLWRALPEDPFGSANSEDEELRAPDALLQRFELEMLEDAETVSAADVTHTAIVTPGDTERVYLFAALLTSKGRIFAVGSRLEPELLGNCQPGSQASPVLLTGKNGMVHAFFPTATAGVSYCLLYDLPVE